MQGNLEISGASGITVEEEGSSQGSVATINFVGPDVTVTVVGNEATVTIGDVSTQANVLKMVSLRG